MQPDTFVGYCCEPATWPCAGNCAVAPGQVLCPQQVGQDGLMRSRARRWARVVDEATWPEILRRYLLATRATMPHPDADHLAADSALMDDDTTAVKVAHLLETQPYHRCPSLLPNWQPLCLLLVDILCCQWCSRCHVSGSMVKGQVLVIACTRPLYFLNLCTSDLFISVFSPFDLASCMLA